MLPRKTSGKVSRHAYARKTDNIAKMDRNAVPACVLLRKSYQNSVPARSVTKIPTVVIQSTFVLL
jgi:hypothetical protein